jgi:AAA15 family ATPase/GTPase
MELVYLWVEDYKNIKKQGFNFSPRFTCEYNDESKELTIDENDDYIPDFFGDNINVTAIVGKNGSGKSSVFEFLTRILVLADNGNTFKEDKSFFYVLSNNSEPYNLKCYSYGISYIKIDGYKCVHNDVSLKNRLIIYDSKLNLDKHLYMAYLNISHFSRDNIIENDKRGDLAKLYYLGVYGQNNFSTQSAEIFKEFNLSRFFLKFYELIGELLSIQEYKQVMYKTFNISNISFIRIKISEEKYDKEFYEVVSKSEWIEYKSYLEKNNYMFFIENIEKYKEFFQKTYKLFRYGNPLSFSLITQNKDTINLSAGEIAILFYLEKISRILLIFIKKQNFDKKKVICLLIDEVDLFLHPNWQKKIVKVLVDFMSAKYDFNFHIILTTHSPFLLSDIPKQNIIFLDKDEKGNCKVVDGLKEKKQTFGANIHTLLSDSFFMEDGLMGEFAKSKIDKAITLLNQDKLDEKDLKYCEQIISIIGEPIVKNQLQRMLDSKRLKKVDEIDAIKQNMIAMQKRLDELEK